MIVQFHGTDIYMTLRNIKLIIARGYDAHMYIYTSHNLFVKKWNWLYAKLQKAIKYEYIVRMRRAIWKFGGSTERKI